MKIDTTSGDFDYTFLSLGAGVQSSALLVLSCTDDRVPKPDVAIFADTGDEPEYVYSYLRLLTEWAKPHGVDVLTATAGVLSDNVREVVKAAEESLDSKVSGWVSVPLYTSRDGHSTGMRARACTGQYKIRPLRQKVREILGYQPGQRVRERVRSLVGITIDEAQRMKAAQAKWLTNSYPLVDLGLHRHDCLKIMVDAGLPEPKKSACVYCPYHDDTHWQWMKDEQPLEFQKAVEFDEMIRAESTGFPAFVHRSMKPLSEVEFNTKDPNQVNLFTNECEGMCGV